VKTMKPATALCFGEALIDFFPAAGGARPLVRVARFERHLGGAPANVAVGLARLGVRTALLARVGLDITSPDFWQGGLTLLEEMLLEAEQLADATAPHPWSQAAT